MCGYVCVCVFKEETKGNKQISQGLAGDIDCLEMRVEIVENREVVAIDPHPPYAWKSPAPCSL